MNESFDFERDLKLLLQNEVKGYGVKISMGQDIDDFLLAYYTLQKKIIHPIRREVRYNPELLEQMDLHPKKFEIQYLEKLFVSGKNVNWHQSERLFQTKAHDHLAYEWNIYHFHLSVNKEKKSQFVKRSNTLLFVYVDGNQAIFLGTDTHKAGVFGETKWQEILHDYFPEVLEPLRETTISEISPNLSGEERQSAWDSGFTLAFTEIRGQIYQSPGIGRATSGHSYIVTNNTLNTLRWLETIEKQFHMHFVAICDLLNITPEIIEFKLLMIAGRITIIESTSKTIILQYPSILDERAIYA